METEIKYFTPREAAKTLPLVRQIVSDILVEGQELKSLAQIHPRTAEIEAQVEVRKTNILNYIEELTEIGCFFKDWNFEFGLVDFPSVIEGEEVLLCWKSDEDEIKFYHGYNDGFKGRKEIPGDYLEI